MPLVSRTFDQLIDFTRTSAATYVDASGRIVPTPASRNLLTFTQEFDNAPWFQSQVSVAANATTAPDGTFTADKLTESAASSLHTLIRTVTTTAAPHTWSCYFKAAERTFALLYHVETNAGVSINLLTGATGTPSGTVAPTASTVTNVGSGWYRLTMTVTATAATNDFRIYTATSLAGGAYTGNGTSGIFIWGAQLEAVPDANLVLGSELVTNGDFASGSTGWTVPAGWSIGSGVATATATNASLISTSAVTAGKVYRVAFDVSSYTSGTLYVRIGAGSAVTVTGAGSKVVYLTATNTSGVEFYGGVVTLSLDNISVKEITGTTGMPTDYTRNNGGVYPPRFDYDPVTLAPKGLLIEEQRTNFLTYSEQFDNAAWSKVDASITANAAVSPDGTSDADALTENTANAVHTFFQTPNISASTTYTWTVYAKRGLGARDLYLQANLQGGGTGLGAGFAWFDLGAGVAAAPVTLTAPFTGVSSSMTPVGNGWYRCTFTFTTNAANTSVVCYTAIYNGGRVYTGDGTSGIFVWGAQLEAGSFATSYIPTVASQVTRTADFATITGANFSQWYNQSAGTLVITATGYNAPTVGQGNAAPTAVSLYATPATSPYAAIGIGRKDTATLNSATGNVYNDSGTVGGALSINTALWNGNTLTAAIAWNGNSDVAFTANGATPATSTAFALPSVDSLQIGRYGSESVSGYWSGHIRSIKYFPTRLSNAQLQALTA